jgi:hypothetical protein
MRRNYHFKPLGPNVKPSPENFGITEKDLTEATALIWKVHPLKSTFKWASVVVGVLLGYQFVFVWCVDLVKKSALGGLYLFVFFSALTGLDNLSLYWVK